jgi:hypothetical protein
MRFHRPRNYSGHSGCGAVFRIQTLRLISKLLCASFFFRKYNNGSTWNHFSPQLTENKSQYWGLLDFLNLRRHHSEFYPENGGSNFLRKYDDLLPDIWWHIFRWSQIVMCKVNLEAFLLSPSSDFIIILSPMVTMRHHGNYGVSLRNPVFCHTLYSYVLYDSRNEHRYFPKRQ